MRRGLGKGSDLDEDVASLVATLHAENELSGHNENWLVSYADMMTLLFGFFAMLYLMNGVEQVKPPPPKPPEASAQTPRTEETAARGGGAPSSPRIHSRKGGAAGGNVGAFLVEFLPPELVTAFGVALALHFLLYRLGERRRRLELLAGAGTAGDGTGLIPPPLTVRQALPATGAVLDDAEVFDGDAAHEPVEIDDAGEGHSPALTDERWLISYADLMTLLFGFFAMLYLMGGNFDAVRKAMEDTFKSIPSKAPPSPPPSMSEKLKLPSDISSESLRNPPKPPPAPPPPPRPAVIPAAAPVAPAPVAATTPPPPATKVPEKPEAKPAVSLRDLEEQQMNALKERLSKLQATRQAGPGGAGGAGGSGDSAGGGVSKGQGAAASSGLGGSGMGGGAGRSTGRGSHSGAGNTICDAASSVPYNAACTGRGFYGCLDPENLAATGGLNGDGNALEYYCEGGRTRICLTWERCPWRGVAEDPKDFPEGLQGVSASPDAMSCSPYGLPQGAGGGGVVYAVCRSKAETCGFSKIYCDPDGRMSVDE